MLNETNIAMHQNFSRFIIQHKTVVRFGLIAFLFQSLQQQQQTRKQVILSSLNQHEFY